MFAYTTATAIFWVLMALVIVPFVRWAIQRHRTRDIRRMLNGKRR